MVIIRIYYPSGQFDLPFDSQQDNVSEAIRQFRQRWPDQPVQGISVFTRKPSV